MELISFRIQNFKSIIDSGECYLAKDITIFAGKNESGKTNILEALEHFNVDKDFQDHHIPAHKDGIHPKLAITIKLLAKELPKYGSTDIIKKMSANDELELRIIKEYPRNYFLDEDSLFKLGLEEAKKHRVEVREEINIYYDELSSLHKTNVPSQANIKLPEPNFGNVDLILERLNDYRNKISNNNKVNNKSIVSDKVNELINLFNSLKKNNDDIEYVHELLNVIPHFVFFKSFEDILPNKIEVESFSSNKWIEAFQKISELDPDLVKSDKSLQKANHEKSLNLEVNEEFSKYWKQDNSEIVIRWDNEFLYFWINEDNKHFKPSMRSKGKQWFLSFYILVSAKTKENKENIILIDEPGLYLHAKAQKDILARLLDLPSQILFSTHSPYLIESNKLSRIRAVIKKENNTEIENKHHKISDKETLTPILTTIGLGINDGIQNLDKVKNIIVEGASDYYLNAFKKINGNNELNIIHGGGATNMPHVGTILQGWGCEVYYLFDNDQGFKQAKKKLDKDWKCTTKDMIGKIPIKNAAIEDILSKDLYHSSILKSDEFKKSKKNSTIANEEKRDKVLDSKCFYEEVIEGDIKIDEGSSENIKTLFKELESKFGNIAKN